MSYEKDISIDPRNMEQENAQHPATHFEYGRKHADALRERRLAELEEQEIFAEVMLQARDALAGQKPAPTETSIRNITEQDPAYKASRRRSIDVAHEVNVLAAAIESLNAKTKSLGNITTMQVTHWQSEPRIEGARQKDTDLIGVAVRDGLGDLDKSSKSSSKKKLNPVG